MPWLNIEGGWPLPPPHQNWPLTHKARQITDIVEGARGAQLSQLPSVQWTQWGAPRLIGGDKLSTTSQEHHLPHFYFCIG